MNWLLFLSQLPTKPSSLRVTVWRKMRAAGALGLQNGVWILPDMPEQTTFLKELLSSVQSQGANGQIFTISPLNPAIEKDILDNFRADRDEEYAEFIERSQEVLAEIKKETSKQKFTFAELEEIEQDIQRMEAWLGKIRKRDFAMVGLTHQALEILNSAKLAFDQFSSQVYARQGLEDSENPGKS